MKAALLYNKDYSNNVVKVYEPKNVNFKRI